MNEPSEAPAPLADGEEIGALLAELARTEETDVLLATLRQDCALTTPQTEPDDGEQG